MRAVREGQMTSGVQTTDVENVGLAEDSRVPVRSGDGHRNLVTGPDADAAEPDLPGRVPVDDRRGSSRSDSIAAGTRPRSASTSSS